MPNLFNSVQNLRPKLRAYNLSHDYQYTTDMGLLAPVFIRDCVPGSFFRVGTHNFTRFTALLSPAMDDINLYVHFWKIPYRLLDPDFTRWIGGEITDEEYDPPYFTPKGVYDAVEDLGELTSSQAFGPGSLWDYCGFPDTFDWSTDKTQYHLRYFSWYAILLRYWYLNENITSGDFGSLLSLCEQMTDGSLHGDCSTYLSTFFALLASCFHYNSSEGVSKTFACHAWNKDYFTSALPFVQKGDPVNIPLTGTAPVSIPQQDINILPMSQSEEGYIAVRGEVGYPMENQGQLETKVPIHEDATVIGGLEYNIPDSSGTHKVQALSAVLAGRKGWALSAGVPLSGTADLSEASAISINEFRVLYALQVFQERKARYGSRYNEYLKGFFNVTSQDARLQMPEWLGGGKCPITISEIAQTSQTGATGTPQGNLAGKGVGFAAGFAGFKSTYIHEESMIVAVCWLQPKGKYAGQGVDKHRSKLRDRFDFFNPSFEHLGEQEIDKRELYAGVTSGVFGYTPHFAEYRYWSNEVHGLFKSSLAYWNTARIFSSAPQLNGDFVYIQPDPLKRIYATTGSENHVLVDLWFEVHALQPMSKYATPMLLN